jgi:hypothetical protein
MLEAFVHHSLYVDPAGVLRLKTPPAQEALNFETRTQFEIWQLLPALSPDVELRWIMPEFKHAWERPGASEELVWLREKNSSNSIMEGCGHFVSLALLSDQGIQKLDTQGLLYRFLWNIQIDSVSKHK